MDPHVVILASSAGGPSAPGAATPVYFRPLLRWSLSAAAGLPRRTMGVSGSAAESELAEALRDIHGVRYYGSRETPLEAARAAASAQSADGDVLVLDAARVLLRLADLEALLARHAIGEAACTALSAPDGSPAGAWCYRRKELDSVAEPRTEHVALRDPVDALAVTDLEKLVAAEHVLQGRLNEELLRRGVLLRDPRTIRVDPASRLAPGVVVEAGSEIVNTGVEAGARIEAGCRLVDSEIGAGSLVRQGSFVEASRLGKGCRVGPYARLAAGSRLEDGASTGCYVELENASLGRGSRAGAHSYIGNCRVGRNVEIGCGFLACAPDDGTGRLSVIEDDAFIGAASQVVSAVSVGRGSFVATGTTITDDAPVESFIISRGRQVIKAGYARRHAPARRHQES